MAPETDYAESTTVSMKKSIKDRLNFAKEISGYKKAQIIEAGLTLWFKKHPEYDVQKAIYNQEESS